MLNRFTSEASRFQKPGPSIESLRFMLPQVFWAGAENTEVSKYFWPGPMSPSDLRGCRSRSGAACCRALPASSPLAVKLIGVPE